MKGDADDYLVDYNTVDGMDNWYADTFKEYVDSFSPSGNIFKTVESATAKVKKEKLIKEMSEMDW